MTSIRCTLNARRAQTPCCRLRVLKSSRNAPSSTSQRMTSRARRGFRLSRTTCIRRSARYPLPEIDTALVLSIVEPLWSRTPTTASRVRGRIETVLGWARVRGYRSTENPARWAGHLEHILPSPNNGTEHLASLPYQQIGSFMAALRAAPGIAARALEFTILTACRTAEVRGARWDEIETDVWVIPAKRIKAGTENTI